MTITTPTMGLQKPEVTETLGPQWANDLNESLDIIDTHDHTPGSGSRITPQGLNINDDLNINTNDVINIDHLRLLDTTGSGLNGVYQSSGNLFWRNGAGADVQITAGSTINVGSLGTIGGDYSTDPNNPLVTFTTSTGAYDFFKNTLGTPIPASINSGKISIFEEVASANGITLQSPSSLASAYTVTLPTVQAAAANSLVQSDSAGQWSFTKTPTVNTLGLNAGVIATPSLYSNSDSATGIAWTAIDVLNLVTGGVRALTVNASQQTLVINGAVSLPSLAIPTDTNTGLFWGNDDTLSITTGGTRTFQQTLTGAIIGRISSNSTDISTFNGQELSFKSDVYSATNYEYIKTRIIDTQSLFFLGARTDASNKLGSSFKYDAVTSEISINIMASSIPLGNSLASATYNEVFKVDNTGIVTLGLQSSNSSNTFVNYAKGFELTNDVYTSTNYDYYSVNTSDTLVSVNYGVRSTGTNKIGYRVEIDSNDNSFTIQTLASASLATKLTAMTPTDELKLTSTEFNLRSGNYESSSSPISFDSFGTYTFKVAGSTVGTWESTGGLKAGPNTSNSTLVHAFRGQNISHQSDVFSSNYEYGLQRIVDTQYLTFHGARVDGSNKKALATRYETTTGDFVWLNSGNISLANDLNTGTYTERMRMTAAGYLQNDNVAVRWRKVTFTMPNSGITASVAHGVTRDKIINLYVTATGTDNFRRYNTVFDVSAPGATVDTTTSNPAQPIIYASGHSGIAIQQVDATNVVIKSGSSATNGQTGTLYIVYEE